MCGLSIPLVAGRITAGSIQEAFPKIGAFLWGLSLLLGAVGALVGSFWRGRYETALFLERIGLDFAGFAALVYGVLIPFFGGLDGLIASAVVIGFGLSCLVRASDIASIFARAADVSSPRIEVEMNELGYLIVGATGLVAALASGFKAWYDRNAVRSKSNLDDTTATINLAAAAREMLDPLRKELAQERRDHSEEIEAERVKVRQVRAELEACANEARELRNELAMARVEADALRREREKDRARIRHLEYLLNTKP